MGNKQHSQLGRIFLLMMFAIPLVPVALFFVYPEFFTNNISFFEKSPPTIEVLNPPKALGLEIGSLQFKLSEKGAGLDEVKVSLEQGKIRSDIFKKEYSGGRSYEDTINVEVKAKELGLREGPVTIEVSAFDKSFWNNATKVNQEFRILYSKPRIEVLTTQHNVAQGGTGLLLYKHVAGEITQSGVYVDKDFFPGFPASQLDPSFSQHPNVYFAFFAIPKTFDSNSQKIKVVAQDIANNSATSTFNYLILKRKFRDVPMKINEDFLRRKLPELLPSYYTLANEQAPAFDVDRAEQSELIRNFRLVNERYRMLLAKSLKDIMSTPLNKKYWTGVYERPVAGSPTSVFGEHRIFDLDGTDAGFSIHDGIDLAATANTPVRPTQAGKVIFADDLGIYGTTVVIDHGFGLTSLYGHLSSLSVANGEEVTTQTTLGRSGSTGMAGGDHLHFEIRVNGQSVTPIEWWDKNWVNDHIEDRFRQILGLVKVAG